MENLWFEVWVPVEGEQAEVAAALLTELGCAGISEGERRLDTFEAPAAETFRADRPGLTAYFPPGPEPAALLDQLGERLAALGVARDALSWRRVGERDWAEEWKQHFPAFQVGPLRVRPSWVAAAAKGEREIILDPGMAFGTGTHGTTRLCLEAVVRCCMAGIPPRRVLDVGTGSGILALAAARLGAGRVLACDIDPEACAAARENVLINALEERIEVTEATLETLIGEYDLVLANILAEELVRLSPALLARLAPGGCLVLSGILAEREDLVRATFDPAFAAPPRVDREGEWLALTYGGC